MITYFLMKRLFHVFSGHLLIFFIPTFRLMPPPSIYLSYTPDFSPFYIESYTYLFTRKLFKVYISHSYCKQNVKKKLRWQIYLRILVKAWMHALFFSRVMQMCVMDPKSPDFYLLFPRGRKLSLTEKLIIEQNIIISFTTFTFSYFLLHWIQPSFKNH